MPSPQCLVAEVRILMVSTVSRDNNVVGVHMLELETAQCYFQLHPQHQYFMKLQVWWLLLLFKFI